MTPPPVSPGRAGGVVGTVLVALWTVGVVAGGQAVGWFVDQASLASGFALPYPLWAGGALGTALLVAVPAVLLATLARPAWARAAGWTWTAAAALLAWLGLARLVPPAEAERYLLLLTALAAAAALALRRLRPAAPADAPAGGPSAAGAARGAAAGVAGPLLGVAAGLLILLPWLWLGAAGGPLETGLAALAALAVGVLAAGLLHLRLWPAYDAGGRARRVLAAGSVAGVALLVLGAGAGTAGPHLAVLPVLAAAGFAAAALRTRGAVTAVVALAACGPLAGVDGEEVTLFLLDRDVPFWALVATGAAVVAAWLAGGLCAGLAAPSPRPVTAAVLAVAALVGAAGVHLGLGQPGFHGDRLFVVLRDQADLSGVTAATGPAARPARVGAVRDALVAHATRSQAGLRRTLAGWGVAYTPYYLVNAVEVHAGPALRPVLERRADVARVLLSPRLRPLPAPVPTVRGDAPAPRAPVWNVAMVGADKMWARGVTGAGVTVGTSDSGVDGAHPALASRYRGGDDSWYDPWNGSRAPTDHGGHGTHTLGTAVGGANIGVAPGATWVGCVNLDRNLGNPARYLDCLQYMLAPFPPGGDPWRDGRPARAPHVLTNSWGCPPTEGCDQASLVPAVRALTAAGIFFVVAAGNEGPRCGSLDDPPAPYADSLTVGAVDRQRRVSDFSSRGPTPDGRVKPDVLAPGADVVSAAPGGGYAAHDGTSMATPHVAGVVALLWSARPALIGDIAGTRALLARTAAPISAGSPTCGAAGNTTGAGLVDALAAVSAT
ncbi:hypothetical protein GCM10010124_22780 [Pilimelia terevasa]|uniref:Peptidase S8/S53 domain-containing protein n=1 Tax=Pilimelia terevasa TaxID=53372 RepID=A0A8J3FHK1_9ACTN|nr:hypothetical protein GCM10010124_22780 [Pilimelia terevasa]